MKEAGPSSQVKVKVAKVLSTLLADYFVVYVKTLNFHWNVRDNRFQMLHELFQKQYEDLAEAIDLIAEQVRILGHMPPASMQQFLKMASLKEIEADLDGDAMIEQLVADHRHLSNACHMGIQLSQKGGDEGTADLLIERLRVHDKTVWMLKSHL